MQRRGQRLSQWNQLRVFAAFIKGLPHLLEERIGLEQARSVVRRRIEERESNFIASAEQGIFNNPRSPYGRLLELAGCGVGDLRQMVRDRGLDASLQALREAGVCVTFEEFKGHRPIVRGGEVIEAHSDDFNNPTFRQYYSVATGGSTGPPRRVLVDLEHWRSRLPTQVIKNHSSGILGVPFAVWAEIPPGYGLEATLLGLPHGCVPDRWFTPVWKGSGGSGLRFRMATRIAIEVARSVDRSVPRPEYLPFDQAGVIARWAEEKIGEQGRCGLIAHVSKALRVALEADRMGIDLTGLTITSGGEPATQAKVDLITKTGARFIPHYFCAEIGPIGFGCPNSPYPNEQHLLLDHLAMITGRRELADFGLSVDAFYFTTLLPSAPKILLNVETDDYGVVETRSCGCPLEELGFTTHIRDVGSFSKATGEGVTLLGSDIERVLEEDLPARFGGTPLDYQLVEEEDEQGFTRLVLLVHPSVTILDEEAVIGTVYAELQRSGSVSASYSRALWSQAGALRVRRQEPLLSPRGKFLPLQARRVAESRRNQ